MKTVAHLLLALSLVANVVLAWRCLAPAPSAASPQPAASAKAGPAKTAAVAPPPAAVRPVATTPASHAELRDRLRALGLPEADVQVAVRAQVEARRLARQREWLAEAARQPWWRGANTPPANTPVQNRELRELRRAEREELLALFGPAALAAPADLERFAYLPPDKAARLAVLERDYADDRRAATENRPGSAETQERLRQLADERDRALAALLTPEEQALRDRLNSQTALNLSDYFPNFSPTAAEAETIYALTRAFDDQFRGFNASAMTNRQAATEKLQQDLRAALGPDRYTEWQRAQRTEYMSLMEMQRRFSLPQPAIDTLAPLPAQALEAAKRIDADPALTPDQKRTARAALAEQVGTKVRTLLGPELGGTYLAEVGRWWMIPLASAAAPGSAPAPAPKR
jgi:hypothetical protein